MEELYSNSNLVKKRKLNATCIDMDRLSSSIHTSMREIEECKSHTSIIIYQPIVLFKQKLKEESSHHFYQYQSNLTMEHRDGVGDGGDESDKSKIMVTHTINYMNRRIFRKRDKMKDCMNADMQTITSFVTLSINNFISDLKICKSNDCFGITQQVDFCKLCCESTCLTNDITKMDLQCCICLTSITNINNLFFSYECKPTYHYFHRVCSENIYYPRKCPICRSEWDADVEEDELSE
jgi:hypothetical protein